VFVSASHGARRWRSKGHAARRGRHRTVQGRPIWTVWRPNSPRLLCSRRRRNPAFALATRRSRRSGAPAAVPADRDYPRGAHGGRRSRGCLCPGAAARDSSVGVNMVAASGHERRRPRRPPRDRNRGVAVVPPQPVRRLLLGDCASPRAAPASRGRVLLPPLVLAAEQARANDSVTIEHTQMALVKVRERSVVLLVERLDFRRAVEDLLVAVIS
jgi:hypothetical protein